MTKRLAKKLVWYDGFRKYNSNTKHKLPKEIRKAMDNKDKWWSRLVAKNAGTITVKDGKITNYVGGNHD